MKYNFCDCNLDERYSFGSMSYILLAILSGMWLSSTNGHGSIQSISRSYNSAVQSVEDIAKVVANLNS